MSDIRSIILQLPACASEYDKVIGLGVHICIMYVRSYVCDPGIVVMKYLYNLKVCAKSECKSLCNKLFYNLYRN